MSKGISPSTLRQTTVAACVLERGKVVWQGDSVQLGADHTLWQRYIGV